MDCVNAAKAIINSLDEYGVDRNKIYIMGKINMALVRYTTSSITVYFVIFETCRFKIIDNPCRP